MSERGWIGYGRRWWGGRQDIPQPVEVLTVGLDESDGNAINSAGALANPGGGFFATFFLVPQDADVYVEQLATDSTQGLDLLVVPTDPSSALDVGNKLRTESYSHPRLAVDLFAASAAAVSVRDPRGALVFDRPGLLVPIGFALQVQHPNAGTAMRACFYFREAR